MKPRLFEAVMADKTTNEGCARQLYENLKPKMTTHPFMKRYTEAGIKEGLFSDSTGALGRMHDTLVSAAQPNLIGRSIITVLPTTEQMERFPLDENADWVPLYLALEETGYNVTLANAHQVKGIPGRKTDQSDSEWLAHLLRGNQIKPSYVPAKHLRELRELTRLRVKYVQNRTQYKNRCQKVLNRVNIRLRSKLSDVFGKAGMEILNGLMAGKTVEAILEHTKNKQLKNRCEEIKSVAKGALSENDIFVLKHLTETIEHLNGQIRDVEARIEMLANQRDVEIVSSVPGVGKRSAAAILGEIGDAKRFSNGKQIASWTGLAPSLYQSAGLTVLGSITKQVLSGLGGIWLR